MQVRVDSDRSPVGLLGDLASLAGSLFSLSSPVTDPITRLSATLEGRYAIEREIGEGGMPELEGKTLADWAEMRGMPPTMETGAELVIDAIRRGGASGIYHVLDEADVEAIMRHPMTAIASDGRLVQPGEGHPHPRWYGTFPRVLGEYVRERGVLTFEDAVRKMTSLPADHMGMSERGVLSEGMIADIVVFDPETVVDRSTFQDPHQYPEGIDFMIINGIVAVDDGVFSDVRAGRVLRR